MAAILLPMVAQTLLAMLLAVSSLAVVVPMVVVPLLAVSLLAVASESLLYWLGSWQLSEESVLAVHMAGTTDVLAVAGTTDRPQGSSSQ